jgi:hypothetical protein
MHLKYGDRTLYNPIDFPLKGNTALKGITRNFFTLLYRFIRCDAVSYYLPAFRNQALHAETSHLLRAHPDAAGADEAVIVRQSLVIATILLSQACGR